MENKHKELAAVSAVLALLSSETTDTFEARIPGNAPSPWQAYGRTQTMQYRDITQRRIIKRNR